MATPDYSVDAINAHGVSSPREKVSSFSFPDPSLASHTLTHERGSGQAAIVELCNLDGFDYVTSSGRSGDCDQLIVRLYTGYMRVLTHA